MACVLPDEDALMSFELECDERLQMTGLHGCMQCEQSGDVLPTRNAIPQGDSNTPPWMPPRSGEQPPLFKVHARKLRPIPQGGRTRAVTSLKTLVDGPA